MQNSLRANLLDIREQHEKQLRDLQEAYGATMLELWVEALTHARCCEWPSKFSPQGFYHGDR